MQYVPVLQYRYSNVLRDGGVGCGETTKKNCNNRDIICLFNGNNLSTRLCAPLAVREEWVPGHGLAPAMSYQQIGGLYGAYDNTFQNTSELTYGDAFSPTPFGYSPNVPARAESFGGVPYSSFATHASASPQHSPQRDGGAGSIVQYAPGYKPTEFNAESRSPTRAVPSLREPSATDYGGFGFRREFNGLGGVGGSGDMPSPAPYSGGAGFGGGGGAGGYGYSGIGGGGGGAAGALYPLRQHHHQQPQQNHHAGLPQSNVHYEAAPRRFTDPKVVRLQSALKAKDALLQELLRKVRKAKDKLEQVWYFSALTVLLLFGGWSGGGV